MRRGKLCPKGTIYLMERGVFFGIIKYLKLLMTPPSLKGIGLGG
jgi:hypothetical protein